ncbi:L antigen family member 3-like isoform X2 [Scleropages formosus]|uniref:L antigen family member 3-like isoform X2 n=1 Tax=Scleropages formosus TaxID=113540 RepID=UPI0008786903|nr:EKC/KEOPS complex subunit LAGE3 isoform X2 [Scleropages formosus]
MELRNIEMAARGGGEDCKKEDKLEFVLHVPLPSEREASIALGSLAPDREPRKGGITKELSALGNVLSVRWTADEARILRVSVGSFLDNLALVLETMEQFGPSVPL